MKLTIPQIRHLRTTFLSFIKMDFQIFLVNVIDNLLYLPTTANKFLITM